MKIALIADDEPLIRRQVAETLTAFGFERILEAENGAQAVDIALVHNPLLLVLDYSMPVMNGISAAEKLSKKLKAPMILLTANADTETVHRARDAGIFDYLLKPFRAEQLAATVEMAIHHFVEISDLREECERLKETLETRKQVERAKGVLIRQGLSEPEAYRKMQKLAMDKRKSLKEVAEAILLMEG